MDTLTSDLQQFPLLSLSRFTRQVGHLSTLKGREICTLQTCQICFLSSCCTAVTLLDDPQRSDKDDEDKMNEYYSQIVHSQ